MRLTSTAAVGLLFALLLSPASLAQSPWISRDTSKTEEKLAVINAGTLVRADHVTVARFRFLLDALSRASGDTPEEVGDKLVASRNAIRTHFGKDVSLLKFAEAAYQARNGITKGRLSEYLSNLAVLTGAL